MNDPIHVLIVEDSPIDAEIAQREIRRAAGPCVFQRVETQPDFLLALEAFQPDLILSDFQMPSFNGLTAVVLAKEHVPLTPIIVWTGSNTEDVAVECMKAGASNYIIKGNIKRLGPAVIRSLEESRLMRQRLKTEETVQLQTAALESAANAILITDCSGTILSVNPAFSAMTGYAADEIVGRTPGVLKSGLQSPSFYKNMWERILAGHVWQGEITNRRKDGRLYTDDTTITPVRGAGGEITHFIGIKTDITDRKHIQQQLLQLQKMESIGTLASGIAHDFNNILGVILGQATMLLNPGQDEERIARGIGSIIKVTERGASLVSRLLTFARKTESVLVPIDVNEIIRGSVQLLEQTLPKTIVITTDLESDIPTVRADSAEIHQLVMNLALNARDAMPAGGTLRFSTSVKDGAAITTKFHGAESAESFIVMRVEDSGTGIDEATKQKIFDPFFTTKDVGKGTGLGLALVHSIVMNYKGFIDVETEIHQGTVFTIYLPSEAPRPKAASVRSDAPGGIERSRGGETVLVIEDEELMQEVLCYSLGAKGYRVLTAKDGEEGLAQFAQHRGEIALVMCDVGLPKMNGIDVIMRIRSIEPAAKVIIASGFIDPAIKSKLQKAGVANFIQKPYKPDFVLQKIREVLDC